jgi:acetyl-CoA C-acetyltransferase
MPGQNNEPIVQITSLTFVSIRQFFAFAQPATTHFKFQIAILARHSRAVQLESVGIIGVGVTQLRASTPDISYKELIFEAAQKAYEDAGVDPRKDVQSFVCSSEDFLEGTSIFDEYVPDQIGAALKPVCTICADGLYSLATAYMQILTGLFDVVAVEAHSKASDIVNISSIYDLALDPIYTRPLGLSASFIPGLEMRKYLESRGATPEDCRMVVSKNRRNALSNGFAMNGGKVDAHSSDHEADVSDPLGSDDIAPLADGAGVVVLASQRVAKDLRDDPVWIKGIGWASDSPTLETRNWSEANYARLASREAYRRARVRNPVQEIQIAEVDDTYSYKELQHLEAIGLTGSNSAHSLLEHGVFDRSGALPVNPSGGSIGMGHTLEMSGLVRVIELVLQLRGEAGGHQVPGVQTGVAQCWRGIPTASGAVAVLSNR